MAIDKTEEDGRAIYRFDSGDVVHHDVFENADVLSSTLFETGLKTADNLIFQGLSIRRDFDLSEQGRDNRFRPIQNEAIQFFGAAWNSLGNDAARVDKVEAHLLAVPTIEPSHAAVAVEDREIRDWWRTLELKERARIIGEFDSNPEYARIELALLRSPYRLGDLEVRTVRECWNRAQRRLHPVEAAAIDHGRSSIEWARRGLTHLAAISQRFMKLDHEAIAYRLESTANDSAKQGFPIFGVNDQQMAVARHRVHLDRLKQAA